MNGDLTFRAVVEAIILAPIGRVAAHNWIVTTRVLEVLEGELGGERFEFRVHSPGRTGLQIGMTSTVRAIPTKDGYIVDENQCSARPLNKSCNRTRSRGSIYDLNHVALAIALAACSHPTPRRAQTAASAPAAASTTTTPGVSAKPAPGAAVPTAPRVTAATGSPKSADGAASSDGPPPESATAPTAKPADGAATTMAADVPPPGGAMAPTATPAAARPPASVAPSNTDAARDLTLRAVIQRIDQVPRDASGVMMNWVVRTRVIEVTVGKLTGTHFEFRVHSPSRAGLEIGATLTIHATWTRDGYYVDENQWRGRPS